MEQNSILSDDQQQQPLPNATAALVLGILSLVFTCAYGLGLILGIIGLVLANKDRRLYNMNPTSYSRNSYSNSNAGRVCSIIGVIISAIFWLLIIFVLIFIGTNADLFRSLSRH